MGLTYDLVYIKELKQKQKNNQKRSIYGRNGPAKQLRIFLTF